MYQKNMLWPISVRNNFLCTSGEEERRFSPDFCSSATLKLQMQKWFCKKYSCGYLLHFCVFFYCLGMGMEKPSASMQLILASFCDLIARPFLTWLGLGKSVISHVNLGFSQPHTAVEKLLHESFLFQLLRGWEGESPSCLIRRLKLLKLELDP